MSDTKITETLVGRYTFEGSAANAALQNTLDTKVTHYYRPDGDTFVVYTVSE